MRRAGARDTAKPAETELLDLARAGDVAAFEELVAPYTDRVFSVVLRMVGNRADAEDASQEALLRAWRGVGRFGGRSTVFTWIYRIAINEATRLIERRAHVNTHVPVDELAAEIAAPSNRGPLGTVEHRELQGRLEHAISQLPSQQRAALVLRDVEGLSTDEAARIAGVGEAAFKSRLHEARMKVRKALGDDVLLASVDTRTV